MHAKYGFLLKKKEMQTKLVSISYVKDEIIAY